MPKNNKTNGQLEAQISEAIIKFEKEFMGHEPAETKTYIIEDMVIMRLRGILAPAEKYLANTGDNPESKDLIRQFRMELREKARALTENIITDVLGKKVMTTLTDISIICDERIIIFILEGAPQIEHKNGD